MSRLHPDVERLALLGLRLVPATARKKGMFKGYLDAATTDLDQLAAWARAYRGCCWKVVPAGSGVWCLDVDVPGAAHRQDGVAAIRALCDQHGPLPPRPHGRSPSGGHLLVFRDAGHLIAPGAGRIAPGLDVLAGRCCPMVPPSRRAGGAYRWITAPWELSPPIAPDWLLALVAPPPRPAMIHAVNDASARRTLRRGLDAIATAPPGSRNHTLNRVAFTAGRRIAGGFLDEGEAVSALYAAGLAAGLTTDETRATIMSGCAAGYRAPIEARTAYA